MNKITLVFHCGLIGADIGGVKSVAGHYTNDYNTDGLKAVKSLQKKFKDGEVEFRVPNRFIKTLTINNIPSKVHMQEDIKTYLSVFNYLENIIVSRENNKSKDRL